MALPHGYTIFIDCMDEYDFGHPQLYVLKGDFTDIRVQRDIPRWYARLVCQVKGHRPIITNFLPGAGRCRRCGADQTAKVRGQKPPQWGPFRREVIGPEDCPIMTRWTLLSGRLGKLLVHHFFPNADDRAIHDHPAPFLTFVLRGGYDDMVPCGYCGGELWRRPGAPVTPENCSRCDGGLLLGDAMRPGSIRYRSSKHQHRTKVLPTGCWTVVVMGPKRQPWGFFLGGRKWGWAEFEERFGDGMRCAEQGAVDRVVEEALGEVEVEDMKLTGIGFRDEEAGEAGFAGLTIERYGSTFELKPNGHWYIDGLRVDPEDERALDEAIGPAFSKLARELREAHVGES